MKKETVIRQNRCDQEMNFFLFGCFFLYMAMQLFVGDTDQLMLVNRINMALYFVFVPGFIFRIGYCFGRTRRLNSEEYGKKLLLKDAGRYYVYFFLLAFGQEVLQMGYTPRYSFSDILTVVSIPSISAVFFTMAVMLLTVRGFYATFAKLAGKRKKMIIVALLCLFSSLLWTEKESYALAAALFGSSAHPAVPTVPYFAYFLLGVWFEEKKPGFQWKMAAGAAAVTAVSLLLYRTPLQDLCRVTISFLPVYLVYVLSELLSDLTLRFEGARLVCNTIEPVFGIYATMLTCLYYIDGYLDMGIVGQSPLRVLLLGTVSALLIYGVVVGCMIFSRIYSKAVDGLYSRVKHKTAAYFVIYSVVFVFLFFVVFLNFIRFNKTFIWNGDGVSQYYPRAVYFARYIRELFAGLFSGNFSLPMYDFSLGFGSEITYSLEPLYFLYALAGEEHVELMYNLLTFLRLYLTGITSSILFLYFKKRYFPTFVASVAYVFCGFTLYGGIKHPMFMVAMIMLPLLIIAIEEILRNNRWYLCTVFVAISLFGNFYFIYMNTIAMGIYFLVRFFCQTEKEKKTIRNFMGKALEICGSYLLGVAMSCIVLVTTFGLYVSSGRSGEAVIKTPSLFYYQEGWLVRCLLSFLTTKNSPGEWLKLGFIPITFLALVFLFLRKGRKELKIFSAIAVVFMACPLFGFIFSGFSSVINRWCYMIALLAAFIVADCLPEMCRMKKRELKICGAAVGIYGFLAFFGNHLHTRFTKLAFICLVLTFVVLLLGQDSFKKISGREKQGLMLLLTVAMLFHQGHTLYSMGGEVKEYTSPGEAKESVEDTPLAAVDELNDDSFYRVATARHAYDTSSAGMLLDYNGITMIYSTFNGCISEFLEKMGCTTYSATQLLGLNNRTFLSALASVKYYSCYDDHTRPLPYGYEDILHTTVNGRETTVSENQFALPLGYTYTNAISEEELEEYSVLERQEVMMQEVVLNDDPDGLAGESSAEITRQKLDILSVDQNGVFLTDHALTAKKTDEDSKYYEITLHFDGQADTETYLVLNHAFLEGDMTENAITLEMKLEDNSLSYRFAADDDRYGSGQEDYVFNLGYHEEPVTSCTIRMSRQGQIQFDSLELYAQPMDNMQQYTDALTEDVLENVEMDTNRVSGTVSLEQDKILVLSIPYQNGWTAYVDGKETKLQRANYMYMALPLSEGDHTIELTFEIPGMKYALVIMAGAVVLFIILCMMRWIRNRKKRKVNSQER